MSFADRHISYHWREVQGTRIFYREAGPRDLPPIVMLHGYPSSSRMYQPLLQLLSSDFHLIAPDYPGFGHSDAPPPRTYAYTFDHLAESMCGLLELLNVDRYVLFMQDYGGPVGFRMALRNPGDVLAMIIQNANAHEEGLGPKWSDISGYWEDRGTHSGELDKFMSLEGAKQRHLGNSPNVERYDPDSWTDEHASLLRRGQCGIQGDLLFDYRNNIKSYPVWQQWLRERLPPLLVLWGRYDKSFVEAGALAYLRDVPDAEIHLLDGGHFLMDEQLEETARLVTDFLCRHFPDRLTVR
jgi:pimeloyl-ACP methyl ester carboxylesterase